MQLIKNGNVYLNGHFQQSDLVINRRKIVAVGMGIGAAPAFAQHISQVYEAKDCYVIPGFIDIHTHGAFGVDVNAATGEDYAKIGHFFACQGTTTWQCSILTDTVEKTGWCIDQAYHHYEMEKKKEQEISLQGPHGNYADLYGIHLEGPFLSAEYKGAMPENLLQKGNLALVQAYQRRAGGIIRYMTVSPEVTGVAGIISGICRTGIKVAIGHSGADYDISMQCIKNGAEAATHTFNAMRLFHQHEPAIMGAVLESDIYCEAICDGKHLHPGSIRLLLKTKGYDRVVAITDSIMAAGLPDGDYHLGVNEVVVKDADAVLKSNGVRAGSVLTTAQAFRNLMAFTGEPAEKVLPLLTENPAKLLGIWDKIGSIAEGKDADICILDKNYQVKDTFVKGRQITK